MQGTGSDELLNTREAAVLLSLSPTTLNSYRSRGLGPRYVRVGVGTQRGRVRYYRRDLQEFIREGVVIRI